MSYIFMDESGDLGFGEGKESSKFFIITFLFSKDKRSIEKIVTLTHRELAKKFRKRKGVLHAVKERPLTRKRLLKRIAKKECFIMVICLNKKKVHTKLKDEKAVLYNYVTNILIDRILTKKIIKDKKVTLIASKRETNKFLNENFKDYLKKSAKGNHNTEINIEIKTPSEEKSLQAVDFISWSIFRKYEYKKGEYYEIISGLIEEENPLFP